MLQPTLTAAKTASDLTVSRAPTRSKSLASLSAFISETSRKSKWATASGAVTAIVALRNSVFGEPVQFVEDDEPDDFDVGATLSRKDQKKKIRAERRKVDPGVENMIRELTLQAVGPIKKDDSFKGRVKQHFRIDDFHRRIIEQRIRVATQPPKYPGCYKLVQSMSFEAVMGLIIVANAICIGWDTYYAAGEPRPSILSASEHVFTLIFVLEFFLRICAFSWVWVFSLWNFCDAALVWFGGVFLVWILIPAKVDVSGVRMLQALRILRIARLCRILRLMPMFRELWILVQGLTDSVQFMVWMYVIAGTLHFGFAIAAMGWIGSHPAFQDDEVVQDWFGSLLGSMFTLFQVMTFDSYSVIVRHIMVEQPECIIFFGVFMGIAGIVLMNLMTAIVVENAFAAAAKDEEAVARLKQLQAKKVQAELRALFKDLDEDGSGSLSKEEFTDVLDDPMFVQKMKALDIELDELPTIFDIFDDGDGLISTDEFCTGLMKMQGKALNRDMLTAMKKFKGANRQVFDMATRMDNLAEPHKFFDNLDSSHERLYKIISLSGDILAAINKIGLVKMIHSSKESFPEPPDTSFSKAPSKDDLVGTYLQKLHRKMQGKEEITDKGDKDEATGGSKDRSASKHRAQARAKRRGRNGKIDRGMSQIEKAVIEVPPSMQASWDKLGLDFHYRGPPSIPKRPTIMQAPFPPDTEPPLYLTMDSGPIGQVMNHPNAIITTPRQDPQPAQTLHPSQIRAETDMMSIRRGAVGGVRQMPNLPRDQMNPMDMTASRHAEDLGGAVRDRGFPPV